MELPLSKREWSLYHELKNLFENNNTQTFDLATYHRYEDWLQLLTDKGVIIEIQVDGAYMYHLKSSFFDFDEWIKDQNKKAKNISKREWRIGLSSAVIGALVGAIVPILIQYLIQ